MCRCLITGVAGFIGSQVAKRLLQLGNTVVGLDDLNEYYDPQLKVDRTMDLAHENFTFLPVDITRSDTVRTLFAGNEFDVVLHFAAHPGVAPSVDHPLRCVKQNLAGFMSILDACREFRPRHFLFASSSSVYGKDTPAPFSPSHRAVSPMSPYAAVKRSEELLAYSYSHAYFLPITAMRFYNVYGPWGRPDNCYFQFTKQIFARETVHLNSDGYIGRSFTYIDSAVDMILANIGSPPKLDTKYGITPFQIVDVAEQRPRPIWIYEIYEYLQKIIGIETEKCKTLSLIHDMSLTLPDMAVLRAEYGRIDPMPIQTGLKMFVDWYKDYYNITG